MGSEQDEFYPERMRISKSVVDEFHAQVPSDLRTEVLNVAVQKALTTSLPQAIKFLNGDRTKAYREVDIAISPDNWHGFHRFIQEVRSKVRKVDEDLLVQHALEHHVKEVIFERRLK